jgi:hypothetical protein
MRRHAVGVIAMVGLAALAAGADDFWVKKDWKTWSKAECKKMLEDSPWARRFLVENRISSRQLPSGSNDMADVPNTGSSLANGGTGEITYYIQLLSAAPVRDAYIRQQQIEQKFDKMSDAEKNSFDAGMEQQLKGVTGDVIAVRVVFESNKPGLGDAVAEFWRSLPPHTVPFNLFLVTERGTQVPPLAFSFIKRADTEFDITFPRSVGADPVIAPDAKSIKIQFPNPTVNYFPEKTATAEYRLDKMMWNGKLAY